MNVRQELRALEQDPQIVVSVEFLGRGLCRACIGDITNGYREIGKLDSFNAAVEWLQEKARQNYPDSKYVQHLPERRGSFYTPAEQFSPVTAPTRG